MKRVIVSALTMALISGAVGCGEKKNDSATIIGGADGPTSIYLVPSTGMGAIMIGITALCAIVIFVTYSCSLRILSNKEL